MKTMKSFQLFLLVVLFSALCVSCYDKEPQGNTTRVKVRLADAPANFNQVNVNITGVELKINDGTTVNLNVTAGIYNLLDYANEIDTLLASGEIPSGTLSQVRLILGTDNSVKVDNVDYPLTTPSALQTGLKLNVNSMITAGMDYNLLLDFDANQSVIKTGNGEYQLKPILRAINEATTGSIHGSIVTTLALPVEVSLTKGTSSYKMVTNMTGNFMVRGLAEGIYTVTIKPQLPYEPITINNVTVTVTKTIELTPIVFL